MAESEILAVIAVMVHLLVEVSVAPSDGSVVPLDESASP